MLEFTALDYREQLRKLLPSGRIWPTAEDSLLMRLLHGLAEELARVHQRTLDLIGELDPRTTSEMIDDWERALGLPDPCAEPPATLEARRAEVVRKLTKTGNQSPQFFIDVAALFGFTVTITEFYDADPFKWRVNAPEETVTYFRAGAGRAGDRLATWGNHLLECVIERLKPAHTTVVFAYS